LACCRDPGRADALRALAGPPALSLHPLDLARFETIDALSAALASNRSIFSSITPESTALPNPTGSARWITIRGRVFKINTEARKMAEHFSPAGARSRKLIVAITSLMGSIADNAAAVRSSTVSKAALNAR